ncbi:MAG: hypothetical protein ACK55I_49715, partial [bacterium]
QTRARAAKSVFRMSFHWNTEALKYNISRPSAQPRHPSKLRSTSAPPPCHRQARRMNWRVAAARC